MLLLLLRVWKRAGGGLSGWKPLEVGADVWLSVSFLCHVGSALLYEWLGVGEPLFDLACAGVELGFDGREVVVGADGEWHVWECCVACASSAMNAEGVLLGYIVGVKFVALVAA